MRFLNLIFTLFFLPSILFLSIFSKKIRTGTKTKFGNYDFDFSNEKNILWLHACSVGEVQLAEQIIEKLKGYQIVLTTSTPQGQEFAKKKLGDVCKKITYFPYDFFFSVKNAFKKINPSVILVVETEIWCEFSRQAKKNNVELLIVNARISDKTFKTYKKLKFLFKQVFKNYFAILAQSKNDAKRYIEIGANPDIVHDFGNIKFDISLPRNLDFDLKQGENPVIVAGSTHKGEDEIIFSVYKKLKNKYKNLKLLIAPRHLERVNAIYKLISEDKTSKLKCALKSNADFIEHDILILDTTGELKNAYSIAKVAFIGGSFNETGGHNPLEATIWGVPVLSGANVKNFRLIYQNLCDFECAKIVETQAELEKSLDKLLGDNFYHQKIMKNCVDVFENNSGATRKTIDFIEKELNYGNRI